VPGRQGRDLAWDGVELVAGGGLDAQRRWFGDHNSGHRVVLIDSREHAEQMTKIDGPSPEAPVQTEPMKAYEVHAEA
jgi:hypothetical protein